MIVAIMQPTYFPWLGYFEQIARADVFCFLDHVQFERSSWQNRNRIAGPNGPLTISVPIVRSGLNTTIKDAEIVQNGWNKKHLKSIAQYYSKAPFFSTYYPGLEAILKMPGVRLGDLNMFIITAICEELKVPNNIVRSSALDCKGHKSDLVLDICKKLGATHYYSARGSRAYLDTNLLLENGIPTTFQSWDHENKLSIIDHLMHTGPAIKEILCRP